MKLSVVVPCYNEADNLTQIFELFTRDFKNETDVEVILVNNGSTDKSAEVFESLLIEYDNSLFKVVNVQKNRGYGNGILSGLEVAQGEVLSWTHADLQTDPKDVLTAYKIYLNIGNNMVFVKGKRKKRGFVADFFTMGMQVLASAALRTKLDDIGAQPKLFSREFYSYYIQDKAPLDFSLDLYAQYWAAKAGRIVDFPVIMKKRLHGEAKGGGSWKTRFKVSKRTLVFINDLRKKVHIEKDVVV